MKKLKELSMYELREELTAAMEHNHICSKIERLYKMNARDIKNEEHNIAHASSMAEREAAEMRLALVRAAAMPVWQDRIDITPIEDEIVSRNGGGNVIL